MVSKSLGWGLLIFEACCDGSLLRKTVVMDGDACFPEWK